MTKDEALKLALEALEEAWYHVGTFQPTEKAIDLYDEARAAIKEALAQPEQEPTKAMIDAAERINWSESDVRGNIVNMWQAMCAAAPPSPQRTWVGLTKEQLATTDWSADFRAGALWAEAKLRSKNGY